MKSIMTVLVMSLVITESIQAQAPVPVGEEFQVNTYTTSFQRNPAVVLAPQGDFVIVWESTGSYDTDTSDTSTQAQRHASNGTPVGGQFQVNSYTTGAQQQAAVAAATPGDFVVVWQSEGSYGTDTGSYSIQAQRYDATGTSVGVQFQVNSLTAGAQQQAAVAADTQGDFVVIWRSSGSYGTDTSSTSIQAQRYDANGTRVGGQFQINSYTTSIQRDPTVAADAQGNFVAVWQSNGSYGNDTSSYSIQAQRHDANGIRVGGQFQVNSYTTGLQFYPAVAVDAQGDFVVVWDSNGSDGTDTSYRSIQAQRYDANGAAVGNQFQVNSYTTGYQSGSAVTAGVQGGFVVVWDSRGSYGTDASNTSIQAQRYDSNGAAVGGQLQVNSYMTFSQLRPAVTAGAQGDFVVVWDSNGSYGTDTSFDSIQGQRFASPIFIDGFESGDTSAWSGQVP